MNKTALVLVLLLGFAPPSRSQSAADLSAKSAAIATSQQAPPITSTNSRVSEPKLPVIEYDACPDKGRTVSDWKIGVESTLYSSWRAPRTQAGVLKAQNVTVLSGVNVIREPDKILVTRPFPDLNLVPGDIILRYGYFGEGVANMWAKGVWHREYDLGRTTEKDAKSGCLSDECDSRVIEEGVKEHWVQIKTGTGVMGWMLADKITHGKFWDSGNFDSLCAD